MKSDKKSYETHNEQYVTYTVEEIRAAHKICTDTKEHYNADNPLGNVMDSCAKNVKIAVDIGCGTGWGPNLLASRFDKVYAIEPSAAALKIAKQLYKNVHITLFNRCFRPQLKEDARNIIWINGFAEEQLGKLHLPHAALFYSACVLSHLDHDTVSAICYNLNKVAKPGSRLAFSENWGPHRSFNLWYSRTTNWWEAQFPGWALTFQKTVGPNQGHKRITGIKYT